MSQGMISHSEPQKCPYNPPCYSPHTCTPPSSMILVGEETRSDTRLSLCQGRGYKLILPSSPMSSPPVILGGTCPSLGDPGALAGLAPHQLLLPYHRGELSRGAEAGQARGVGAASHPRTRAAGVTALACRRMVTDARAMPPSLRPCPPRAGPKPLLA